MTWRELELLEEVGLTLYERKALAALMVEGVADAETLCREGDVPSSKIYLAMEKLRRLELVEIQPTRPKLYSALPAHEVVDRLIGISRERIENFCERAEKLRTILASQVGRVRGRRTFVDLALGMESHVKRHVMHLAAAQNRIWSYMEQGDLDAIDATAAKGFPVLRRIARNAAGRKLDQRVVFGFTHRNAPRLIEFLHKHRAQMEHVTGVRYSGELGHPFHVVDEDVVILCLDHPFIPEGRFASLLVRDKDLAQQLADGFQKLWSKAMHNLREIDFHPGAAPRRGGS
jgi:sugar-specific transcriptional regulator TrmB